MRNVNFILLLFILNCFSANSQIVYEHTYPYANGPTKTRVQLKDIGNNDYKYIYTDYSTNELKIFNIDHSPFLTILLPVPMINEQEYVVGYVTKSLFDCDTTMIEYALMPVNWRKTLYINRQDGTVLFSQDSTVATYCIGCFSGSHDIRPIVNTPYGAKMFLAKNDSNGFQMNVDVFSLCGSLPMEADLVIDDSEVLTVYPNPAHESQIYFKLSKFNNSNNSSKSKLEVFNSMGSLLQSIEKNDNNDLFIFDGSLYNSGVYTYRLVSNNNILQSGKFIIN